MSVNVQTPDGLVRIAGNGWDTEIDSELSETSTNPVQNKAVAAKINELQENAVAVNGELSTVKQSIDSIAIGNGKITITQNGVEKGSATVNQSNDVTIELSDTVYNNMQAATASTAGQPGLVPAPEAGSQEKYLRGDGTWQTPPVNTGPKGDTGEKGEKGDTGAAGAAAGFGTPTATVDANVGTPSVTVTASGANTAKVFNFAFKNLKGAKGDKGDTGATGATGPSGATTADASTTVRGLVNTGTQTFGGNKTFNGSVTMNSTVRATNNGRMVSIQSSAPSDTGMLWAW